MRFYGGSCSPAKRKDPFSSSLGVEPAGIIALAGGGAAASGGTIEPRKALNSTRSHAPLLASAAPISTCRSLEAVGDSSARYATKAGGRQGLGERAREGEEWPWESRANLDAIQPELDEEGRVRLEGRV